MNPHISEDFALSSAMAEGRTALTQRVADFLVQFAPFKDMGADSLGYLAVHLKLKMFPSGSEVIGPDAGIARELFILERGKVQARQVGEMAVTEYTLMNLTPGESFPIGAVTAARPSTNRYTALSDVFCYVLSAEHFQRLMETSPEFNAFCTRYIADLLNQSRVQLQMLFSQRASEQQSLNTALSGLTKTTNSIVVTPEQSLKSALESMSTGRVKMLAVLDANQRPVGVLSRTDLLDKVILPSVDLASPVSSVMQTPAICLDDHQTAYDAVLLMAKKGINQLLVTDAHGIFVGSVTEKDLFALQRVGLRQIRASIEAAQSVDALLHSVSDIRQLAFNMLAQGVGAEQLTRFISLLNDALTKRIIELNLEQHDLNGTDWCWLAFGSEGRDEQTFSTDQDNGIVFSCNDLESPEVLRQRFLTFARQVNEDLDQCGFPLCKGNIMASNPQWCMSLTEWKQQFAEWIYAPVPDALLNASIFFDFRPLYGATLLANKLREHLLGLTTQNPLFLRAMASNALQVEPPIGTFRDFLTDLEPEQPGAIDLKKYGSRLFVDAARIYALASGVESSNTVERLRVAGARRSINNDEIDAYIEALQFIQLLRLRHQQLDDRPGMQGNNLIYPDRLNELDRRILKEAFKQAKKLQQRLKLDYQTA